VHTAVAGHPQGAHRQRGVRRGQLAIPRTRHAGVGADLGADPGWVGRDGESQPRSRRSTLTYMRCRASMSVTRTHSLTLWIEACSTPSSTTSAPGGAMKRPSEVPPPVEVVELGVLNASIHKVNECVRVTDIEALHRMYVNVL